MREYHVPEVVAKAIENLLSAYDKYRVCRANFKRASEQSYREGVPESVVDAVDEAYYGVEDALQDVPTDSRVLDQPAVLVKFG